MVIRELQDAGPHALKLERLPGTAAKSRDALYACNFVALGRAMIEIRSLSAISDQSWSERVTSRLLTLLENMVRWDGR